MINPDNDNYNYREPFLGEVRTFFGVLEQYQYSKKLHRTDWFEVMQHPTEGETK